MGKSIFKYFNFELLLLLQFESFRVNILDKKINNNGLDRFVSIEIVICIIVSIVFGMFVIIIGRSML